MKQYGVIQALLSDRIGLDPETIGKNVIKNESESLMKRAGVADEDAYLNRLASAPHELQNLIEKVVVPETWFFRDREAYRFLRHHVRERVSKSGASNLRILSAPCSTGEEPYSIAMTLLDEGLPPESIHIVAADISERAIETARRGVYCAASFRGDTKNYQDRYFLPSGGGTQISPRVSDLVAFHVDNLAARDFMADSGSFQMIFCKNLLIYMTAPARQTIFASLDRLLEPGGILFTGHSELTSFLQWGYDAVKHARSFACAKPTGPLADKRKGAAAPMKRTESLRARALPSKKKPAILEGPPTKRPGIPNTRGGPQPENEQVESPLVVIRRLADKGALDEASGLCERYLEENVACKEGYCLMGLIDRALNRTEKAEALFRKALYLDPSYYEALLHMSLLCSQKGDERAAALFRERMRRLEEGENGKGDAA